LAKDSKANALSNIPLRWMMREIVKARCDIIFDKTALELWKIPTATIEQVTRTRGPSLFALRGDESELALAQEILDKHRALSVGEATASTSASTIQSNGAQPEPPTPVNIHAALDVVDAIQGMGDAFKRNPFWWMLEFVPTYREWQNDKNEWVGKWGWVSVSRHLFTILTTCRFHLSRGRDVPSQPLFHESVKTRMDNPVLNYSPRAQYEKGTEKYVT